MNISKTYINMCSSAKVMQHEKYGIGFDEGDFIYDGYKVRVVGHDFINIKRIDSKYNINVFKFAMIENHAECNIEFDINSYDVVHKYGKYIIDSIQNPVWLPRLDQLLDLFGNTNEIRNQTVQRFAYFIAKNKFLNPSLEENALTFMMYKIYNLKYYMSDSGVFGWDKLTEYNKEH